MVGNEPRSARKITNSNPKVRRTGDRGRREMAGVVPPLGQAIVRTVVTGSTMGSGSGTWLGARRGRDRRSRRRRVGEDRGAAGAACDDRGDEGGGEHVRDPERHRWLLDNGIVRLSSTVDSHATEPCRDPLDGPVGVVFLAGDGEGPERRRRRLTRWVSTGSRRIGSRGSSCGAWAGFCRLYATRDIALTPRSSHHRGFRLGFGGGQPVGHEPLDAAGIHQFQRPSSRIVAGTSRARTTVASSATAIASRARAP